MSQSRSVSPAHLTLSLDGTGFSKAIPVRVRNVPDAHLERCLKDAAERLINDYMALREAAKNPG